MKRALPITAIALTLALAAITIAGVWRNLSVYLTADHQVVEARHAVYDTQALLLAVATSELADRTYLLNSDPVQLGRFEDSVANLKASMESLDASLGALDLQSHMDLLRPVLAKRADDLRQSIELSRAGKRTEAVELVLSPRSQALRMDIRERLLALRTLSEDRLASRLSVCRQCTRAMTYWVFAGLGAIGVEASALVVIFWRGERRREAHEFELTRSRSAADAANHAKDEFLAVLSHELRTPLTPALLMISAMEKDASEGEQREQCAMIRREMELEARLIDDLLNISHVMRGTLALHLSPTCVSPLLELVIKGHGDEITRKSLRLTTDFAATSDLVLAEETRLHQVFWHVVGNAVKFTPDGGTILIRTINPDSQLVVTVTDSGPGFDEAQKARMFAPFWQNDARLTRQFGGLGLGLAVSRRVVELHRGTLTAQSPGTGQGATFTISLPIHKPAA